MSAAAATLLSMGTVFIVVGITRKIFVETGRMVLIEHLREDWAYRLPFRLRNNRYRGFSRNCYQLLAILYYIVKAIIILPFCACYYILAGFLFAIKWSCSSNSETTCTEQEDDFESNESRFP